MTVDPFRASMDIGHVVLVDRAARVIVAWLELFLDRVTTEQWLKRAPDVVGSDLVSWGRVSPEEIFSLLDLTDDGEGREMFRAVVATYAETETFISLFWHRRETG